MSEITALPAGTKCPYQRSYLYRTGQYAIEVGFDDLTEIIELVEALWDSLVLDARDEKIGGNFACLLDYLYGVREWTGWGGVPGALL